MNSFILSLFTLVNSAIINISTYGIVMISETKLSNKDRAVVIYIYSKVIMHLLINHDKHGRANQKKIPLNSP